MKNLFNKRKTDVLKIANCIQVAIAVILVFNFIVLLRNLDSLNKQIELTEILNQPICGVKEVTVGIDNAKDIEISAVIANSGNYTAQNVSIEWEFYHIKDLDKKWKFAKIESWKKRTFSEKLGIVIMPKHEFIIPLVIVKKEGFDSLVHGYETGVGVTLTIEYKDKKDNPQTYRSLFLIYRLGPADSYKAQIQESSYNESLLGVPEEKDLQKLDATTTTSTSSHDVSATIQR